MGNTPPTHNKKTTAIEAADNVDLNGKIVLVTGCNTGIGKETVRVLAIQGAKVYMLCRNLTKANTARDDLIKSIKSKENKSFDETKLIVMELDLSSLLSIRRCVGTFLSLNEPIDYLICNGGIMNIPEFQPSAEGYEKQFAVNHLGHFYLSLLLTPILLKCKPCRVIVVASSAHSSSPKINVPNNFIIDGIKRKDGPPYFASTIMKGYENYGLSKACNILFAREYNRRYCSQGVICVSLHPGVINTQLFKTSGTVMNFFMNVGSTFLKTVEQGAATHVRCVVMSDDEICGGHFYKDCNEANDALRNDVKPNRGVTVQHKPKTDNASETVKEVGNNDKVEVDEKDKDKGKEEENVDKVEQDNKNDEINLKEEKKQDVSDNDEKEDVNSAEYKLWEWSELLITEKGFKLDMVGFEEEEKERLEKEMKEKEEQERLVKEKAEKEEKERKENEKVDGDKKEEIVEKIVEKVVDDQKEDEDGGKDKNEDKSDNVDDKDKDDGNKEDVKGNGEVVQEQDKE